MKKFLLKILVYFIFLYLFSLGLQNLIDSGLRKYDNKTYVVLNDIFKKKIKADIIILGSSRAQTQIDPKIIENNTNLFCYNLGINGGRLIAQNAVWESYLSQNSKPRILMQSADLFLLQKDVRIPFKEQFLPYLSEPGISSNLSEIEDNIWIEKIIPSYKYRGLGTTVFLGLKSYLNLMPKPKSILYKGYYGSNKKWNFSFEKYRSTHPKRIIPSDSLGYGFYLFSPRRGVIAQTNIRRDYRRY